MESVCDLSDRSTDHHCHFPHQAHQQSSSAITTGTGKSQETSRKVYPHQKPFLSNMSHEIRTPLNALSGFSAILTEESIDNETKQQCNDIIQQNSELLLKLINDVIDLSSLEIGKMQFKFNECDIVALCRNVIDMVEKIKQTQAEVRFSTSQFTEADHGQCPPATSTDQSAYQRHKVYCTRHYHPGTGETNGRYGPFLR